MKILTKYRSIDLVQRDEQQSLQVHHEWVRTCSLRALNGVWKVFLNISILNCNLFLCFFCRCRLCDYWLFYITYINYIDKLSLQHKQLLIPTANYSFGVRSLQTIPKIQFFVIFFLPLFSGKIETKNDNNKK